MPGDPQGLGPILSLRMRTNWQSAEVPVKPQPMITKVNAMIYLNPCRISIYVMPRCFTPYTENMRRGLIGRNRFVFTNELIVNQGTSREQILHWAILGPAVLGFSADLTKFFATLWVSGSPFPEESAPWQNYNLTSNMELRAHHC
jgi:hypothetical protein